MTSYIYMALIAFIYAVINTIVFRCDRSIFQKLNQNWWNPFKSYTAVKLIANYLRPDAYHILGYLLQFAIVGSVVNHENVLGYWFFFGWRINLDVFGYLFVWGVFFEIPWRLMKRPPLNQ